jgi:hypothetical protein
MTETTGICPNGSKLPVRTLYAKPIVSSFLRFPHSLGMDPVRLLLATETYVRFVSPPIFGESVPVKLLKCISAVSNDSAIARLSSVPLNWFP